MKKERVMLAATEEVLTKLSSAKVFSFVDTASRFWQIMKVVCSLHLSCHLLDIALNGPHSA